MTDLREAAPLPLLCFHRHGQLAHRSLIGRTLLHFGDVPRPRRVAALGRLHGAIRLSDEPHLSLQTPDFRGSCSLYRSTEVAHTPRFASLVWKAEKVCMRHVRCERAWRTTGPNLTRAITQWRSVCTLNNVCDESILVLVILRSLADSALP